MFSFFISVLLVIVIGILVFPFLNRKETRLIGGLAATLDEESVNLSIERSTLAASLSELEVDFEQGKVTPSDYESQKLGLEHSLLTVLDRLEALGPEAAPTSKKKRKKAPSDEAPSRTLRWLPMTSLALLVIGGSTGLYQLIHWKFEQQTFASDTGQGVSAASPINPAEMVARLENRLKENPDDLQGQMMIGRSYIAMERWEDAKKAFVKVLELDPRNYTAHYRLGEIILSNPVTGTAEESEAALGHFDKALISVPQDASILWAKGIALLQLGRPFEADEVWTEAYQYIPRETAEAEMVRRALEDLRAGRMPSSQ